MKNRKYVAWLYEQLPGLVSEGVLPTESADALRRHFGEAAAGRSGRRWLVVLFSIIGTALIGGGIILLLAHNWEQLSRPVRATIAFLPLLVAQGLAAWVLWSRRPSTALREGVGTFLTLSIGACISLISQTYNLGGDFGDFMLTWTLLALPVAYLLGATVPALLYLVGITVWTGTVWDDGWKSLGYWPLLAAAIPFLWLTARKNRYHPRPVVFCWVLTLTLPIALGVSLHKVLNASNAWLVVYIALGGVLFLIGNRWWGGATAFWQRPFQSLSALGMTGCGIALSFNVVWKELAHPHGWAPVIDAVGWEWITWGVMVAWVIAAVALWADCLWRRDWAVLPMGTMPLVAFASYVLVETSEQAAIGAILFNVYLFLLGMGTLMAGVRERRLGVVNGGMVVLAALILARFFDADIGFVARGVAFIVIGVLFLTTNLGLLRWKGAVQ
ncbi:MAG TPA: DUF2157 domain-containing protein [Verrucomicrobiae bacterium]|nr:DUF2157 domain-containing protein [Verrucomicrobiae bacterium]